MVKILFHFFSMKRHGNLFEQVVTMDNLRLAFYKAARGKHWQEQVQEVEQDLDNKLREIQQMLINKTFKTSKYKTKIIHEPKERIIYVLPFFPDRIVQHAIINVLEPIWSNLMLFDSYACRKGKGQHRASRRLMEFIGGNPDLFCLQGDISKFFPSMNHAIIKAILKRKIKDKDLLWLLFDIIDSIDGDCNVPIGNLLSQWLGNLYLNELDTYIKQHWRIKCYIRYCDDFLIIHADKALLNQIKAELPTFLADKLKLRLSKLELYPVTHGIDFIGYRHFPARYVLVRKRTVKRMRKTLKHYRGDNSEKANAVRCSINGWLLAANTYNLRQKIKEQYL